MRNVVVGTRALDAGSSRRRWVGLDDGTGDSLTCLVHRPRGALRGPAVLLVHGLGGDESSTYMRNTAAALLRAGHPVIRMNMRGAGPSGRRCRESYHAGRSRDIRYMVAGLAATEPDLGLRGFVVAGFSIGGNVVLNFLARDAHDLPVLGGAAISAPIDLEQSVRALLRRRNVLYHRAMLRSVKRSSLRPEAGLDTKLALAVGRTRTLFEFDETLIAPQNGFAGAIHYYEKCSALHVAADIRLPTLVVGSTDDPVVPPAQYEDLVRRSIPSVELVVSGGGGHVGFHDSGPRSPLHDRLLLGWLAEI